MIRRPNIFVSLLTLAAVVCLLCATIERRAAAREARAFDSTATLTILPAHATAPTPQGARGGRQRLRRGNRTRSPRTTRAANAYKVFEHDSPTHRAATCNSCHTIESVKRIDVVEYPDHDACISCHRQQFFNGARPNICTICHTVVSPRDGSRFRFPKPAATSEFASIFPHDKHQYVIAELAPAHRTNGDWRFVRASFATAQDAPPKPTESCATCHATDTIERPAPAEWIEDKELNTPGKIEKVPTAGTFKASPEGHASCFSCHFQTQQPVATDCAGCHGLTRTSSDRVRAATSPNPHAVATQRAQLKVVRAHTPDVWLERVSAKFRHEREDHKGFSCTSCHTNILEATTLDRLAPEVPLATCAGCHAGTRKDIQRELDKVKADAGYSCSYCHLPEIGKRDIPASHYQIVGRTPGASRTGAREAKQN